MDNSLAGEEASVRASNLSTYTILAESNKNRRLSLLTVVPFGSIIAMIGTIWGGSSNPAIGELSLPIGVLGVLLVTGLFYMALGSTLHDEEYQVVIRALATSMHLPIVEKPSHFSRRVITFLFASSVGSFTCIGAWFVFPGLGPLLGAVGTIIAGIIGSIVVHKA